MKIVTLASPAGLFLALILIRPQFASDKWTDRLKSEGMRPVFSSIRHPQSNSVERIHGKLGRFLGTLVQEKYTSWARFVKDIQEIMNEVHHDCTNFTQVELHLGIKPKRIWEKWFEVPTTTCEMPVYQKLFLARENMHRKLKNKADNRNKLNKHFSFAVGDAVLVKSLNYSNLLENKVAKFFKVYEGAHNISKKISSNTYILYDEELKRERRQFHVKLLKPYYREDASDTSREH